MSFESIAIKTPDKEKYYEKLCNLLSQDLDFHHENGNYSAHNFHAFPAKFPPQLPHKFITALTDKGDTVLDPMSGSGTTVLETLLLGRKSIGFDIDPQALKIATVKTTPLYKKQLVDYGNAVIKKATASAKINALALAKQLGNQWDTETKAFVDYWFASETQIELQALRNEIAAIEKKSIRNFFEVIFSAIIITKSGGVSLAFDLAHTRPHRAKVVINQNNDVISGREALINPSSRVKLLTKTLRSPLLEFEKRLYKNLQGVISPDAQLFPCQVQLANAQKLPVANDSIDLIVTSPPYASNAIDYMRAHKFTLVWFDYSIDELSRKRGEYIGGELLKDFVFEDLPENTTEVVVKLSAVDSKKALVLQRYYSEMTRVIREMYRVLKPGKAAIVVVGNSIMRNIDTQIPECLAEIGRFIGFEVPKIGIRNLDRNRRMLPASIKPDAESLIQQRMHQEYVIGLYKPENVN